MLNSAFKLYRSIEFFNLGFQLSFILRFFNVQVTGVQAILVKTAEHVSRHKKVSVNVHLVFKAFFAKKVDIRIGQLLR